MYVRKKIISKFRWHCISVWSLAKIKFLQTFQNLQYLIYFQEDQQSYKIWVVDGGEAVTTGAGRRTAIGPLHGAGGETGTDIILIDGLTLVHLA